MIIGTAGHVDHGKSALVTALTGQPMDRLVEERRRGITIDLNFAPLELRQGTVAGIVDVPGHEDFVRTMVAGASGMDVAMLVVAADEGIMPQTREHLLVLEQLGVPVGIPVLTKADAADPEWLELVRQEVIELLEASTVPFGLPVVTSARTGEGLDALRNRLIDIADSLSPRTVDDLFRLSVDRVFTVAGTGTVVTGTAISGSVAIGDEVTLLPPNLQARIRSIESHGKPLVRSTPRMRIAIGLSGVERGEISRGVVLVSSSEPWQATSRLDVELRLANEGPPLRDRSRVRVHHGTAEVMARVRLKAPLEAGGSALARLELEAPLVARGNDRMVLRSFSPVTVIGGARVLDPLPEPRGRMPPVASMEPSALVDALVGRRRQGLELRLLPIVSGLTPAACDTLVTNSESLMPTGGILVRREEVDRVAEAAVLAVQAFHRHSPHERGMSIETLRHSLRAPAQVASAALEVARRSGRLRLENGLVAIKGFTPKARASEVDQRRLVAALKEAGLSPPTTTELAARLGITQAEAVLRAAAARGEVVLLEPGRYVAPEALEVFEAELMDIGALGEVTPGLLRERTGLSRKFLIPLLEWADRTGITYRAGDGRRLRRPVPGATRDA